MDDIDVYVDGCIDVYMDIYRLHTHIYIYRGICS